MHPFVYLASQSPRRRQLLDQLGVRHELLLPDATEDAEALEHERAGELPLDYVQRVTLAKLGAARQRLARRGWPLAPVLCSDTTVALGHRILGKPVDAQDATRTLRLLSGQSHQVLTAVALWDGGSDDKAGVGEHLAVSVSTVEFAELPASVIAAYVASGDPFGKAGAYAIQSALAGWIAQIGGSYSAIMGLPLFETRQLLQQAGVACPLLN